jgi:prepilin-type N-terminal cleavage/methylation domain-containing protein
MIMRYSRQNGFTLIEIAVVLVIVAVLLGSFIGTFSDRIDTSQRDRTKTELAEIKNVLQAYAFTRGGPAYLPCPDISAPPDGLEDRTGNTCDAAVGAIGVLPWRDLGLGESDPWGNRYQYWVSNNYSNTAGFTLSSSDTGAGNAGILTRRNNAAVPILTNAVAVVFSRGKNSLGAISVEDVVQPAIPAPGGTYDDENENNDANSVFMSRPPTDVGVAAAGGVFDDMLIWINSYELKAKMIEAGITLPP